MKRTLIIVGSVVVVILLIVRMFFVIASREDGQHKRFVEALNYDFSARIDSVGLFNDHARVGFIYFHVTNGTVNVDEKKARRKIKRGDKLRFLVPKDDNQFEIFARDAKDYQKNDSLYINTSADEIVVFREGKEVARKIISENLRGG